MFGKANYDQGGLSIQGASQISIADAPQFASAQSCKDLAQWLQGRADSGKNSYGFKTVNVVQITMHVEDFLMCGGTSLAEVAWNAYVKFDYQAYLKSYHNAPHSGGQAVAADIAAEKSACLVAPCYVAPGGGALPQPQDHRVNRKWIQSSIWTTLAKVNNASWQVFSESGIRYAQLLVVTLVISVLFACVVTLRGIWAFLLPKGFEDIQISADGSLIGLALSGSDHFCCVVCDAESGVALRWAEFDGKPWSLELSRDLSTWAALFHDGRIESARVASGQRHSAKPSRNSRR